MLFNSLVFLVFGALFFLLWPLARRPDARRYAFIVAASFVFYGWWDWRFLFLILASGLLDFYAALGIQRFPRWRGRLLGISLIGNVGSLVTFKYLGFFTESLDGLLSSWGLPGAVPVVHLTLPVGISFYTFQSMSYTIDVYRGSLAPTRNVLHFFSYLAMFPQLVAGPIVRARELLPQLESGNPPTDEQRWEGVRLLACGYFKKVVLADTFAPFVDAAFSNASPTASGPYWWIIVSMFAFQIYFDFSGYTDIARGLAHWMGYDFPVNFDHPYASTSFREFWGRWHISLSTWFRDYLYIPLGGNRAGAAAGHRNMWITMVTSGLWHGAAWTFVAWGALHALYLSIERVTTWPARLGRIPGGRMLAALAVTLQVWVAWVFFRAESFGQAWQILGLMFDPHHFVLAPIPKLLSGMPMLLLGLAMLREAWFFLGLDRSRLARSPARVWWDPVVVSILVAACVYLRGPGQAFIYFQF